MTTERVTYGRSTGYVAGGAARRSAGNARPGVAMRANAARTTGVRPAAGAKRASGVRPGADVRPGNDGARPSSDARRPAIKTYSVQRAPSAASMPRRKTANAPRNTSGGSRRQSGASNRGRKAGWSGIPARLRLVIVCLVLLACLFGVAKLAQHSGSADVGETFVENVSINGISLTGYTHEQGIALMNQVRDRILNTTYTLTYADRSWSFTPSEFSAEISFDSELERAWNLGHVGDRASRRSVIESLKTVPMDFTAEFSYDEAKLDAFIEEIAEQVAVAPIDAEVTLTNEKPVITRASQTGLALDKAEAKANLESILTTGDGETSLPVKTVQPTVVSDGMEMNVIARFSTDVSFRGPKSRSNVRLALNYFNQFAVYPGYTVDFNEIVGPRTEAAGFEKAPEYAGNETVEGVGGGVCQASTTLYNAAVMAGMTIIERNRHSMMVSYVEPSQDAAVEYGSKNFIFRNDTEHTIYIYTSVNTEVATVTIYGTRPEYFHRLESVIISQQKSDRVRYEDDTEGTHVYYVTDPPKLKAEAHGQCESEGWIVAYDWNTKEEVSREQYSNDVYSAGWNVYWRGIHNADGSIASST